MNLRSVGILPQLYRASEPRTRRLKITANETFKTLTDLACFDLLFLHAVAALYSTINEFSIVPRYVSRFCTTIHSPLYYLFIRLLLLCPVILTEAKFTHQK